MDSKTIKHIDNKMTRHDKILNDLNTVKTISKNDKLIIKNDEIIIHPYSSTRSLIRWWNNYSRADSIEFLNNLYDNISLYIIELSSISIKTDPSVKKRQRRRKNRAANRKKTSLIQTCKDSKAGLLHLIITYKDDEKFTDFVNRLFSIIDKFD